MIINQLSLTSFRHAFQTYFRTNLGSNSISAMKSTNERVRKERLENQGTQTRSSNPKSAHNTRQYEVARNLKSS
jgi:hypothetical protein